MAEPSSALTGRPWITVCALSYGDHANLCSRMLRSIYVHTAPSMFDLRLGLNAPCEATVKVAREFAGRYSNIRLTISEENLFKNRMMRRLFHDEPITTEWTAWFDDDSHVLRSDWLHRLAIRMALRPEVASWGVKYVLFPDEAALAFVQSAYWYRGKAWSIHRNERGEPVPSFIFPTGGFWVVRTRILQELDWPDRRLQQAGDDFFFGEALRQNGYEVGSFERCVAVSDAPRRNAGAGEVTTIPVA